MGLQRWRSGNWSLLPDAHSIDSINRENENVLYTSNSKEPPKLTAVVLSGSLARVAPELVGSTRDK